MSDVSSVSVADICVIACAEAWRGDGEIVASPMLNVPTLGARVAASTWEPDLLLSDGEAYFLAKPIPIGVRADKVIEGYFPFRHVFDVVWSGKRHVMMGPSQIGRYGDANISCLGDWAKPTRQMLGSRGAPGNTASHQTSYWVPKHSTRVFVESVDMVSGIGYREAAASGPTVEKQHEIRRVVSNLGVFDFNTPDHSMRLVSTHPGVSIDDVVAATGFELVIGDVSVTREPTAEEMAAIEQLDPKGLRHREVSA